MKGVGNMTNKPFWMKLIVYVVVFMAVVYEILPTNVVFAGFTGEEEYIEPEGWTNGEYRVFEAEEEGYYSVWGLTQSIFKKVDGKYQKVEVNTSSITHGQLTSEEALHYTTEYSDVYLEKGKYYVGKNTEIGSTVRQESLIGGEDVAGLFETIVSKILLLIGTGFYGLFSLAIGQKMTLEDIIFNNYTNTKLSLY